MMSARGAQARRRRRLGAGRWPGTHGRPIERFVCSFLAVLHFCGLGNDVFFMGVVVGGNKYGGRE